MRVALIVIAGLALGGCNMVTSTKPLFFAADARGQPQLRPGVWSDEKAGCAYDNTKPVDQWPGCADGWVVRAGTVLTGQGKGLPIDQWTAYPYLLARGDPPVLQISAGDGTAAPIYLYAGLRPLKKDAQGRVVEYTIWPAQCGPPPPADSQNPVTTTQPIDGLAIDPAKQDCVASAQGPVRESARLSEAWLGTDQEGRDRARWIRDGAR